MISSYYLLPQGDYRDRQREQNKIMDAVSQVNAMVLGLSPAMAIGVSYLNIAHATGLMATNAAFSQQQQALLSLAQMAKNKSASKFKIKS